ncbi:MAG: Asp-tRNA(Asn)/Glu-tRNA(Gln) amidotransferase subunit GatC [Candidatus Babeliales bacterium]|jgi:aspartyl-tRNA(Asn)/glutamyl-tRNA(Gln) amidotransferase subunit C
MPTITRQELMHIAHLSALKLEDHEIDLFTQQIQTILAYIDQLQSVTITTHAQSIRNVNILRNDVAIKGNAKAVLAQAPQVDDVFFAVPKILDEKKSEGSL